MRRRARSALTGLLGAAIAVAAGLAVLAQTGDNDAGGGAAAPPGPPALQPSPGVETPPANAVPATKPRAPAANSIAAAPAAKPLSPPAASIPARSPAAILQALDKVTAETMRFAVPIGERVRYKNLVFQVKACETSALGTASPQASAYVVIDSAPLPADGVTPTPPKEVFHGWMFASSPGLDPLQHPIYDAWLIACMATPPRT